MATKVELPDFEKMFKPAVQYFRARGGTMTIEEMEDAVAAAMKLSDGFLPLPHGDGSRKHFDCGLTWVRTNLKKLGAPKTVNAAFCVTASVGPELVAP